MQDDGAIPRTNVLGVGVSSINMDTAVDLLLGARSHDQKGYVCVTSVHGVIESQRDPMLKQIHNQSFMTVPDGMPNVWMGREQGFIHMGRVYGPDLMLSVCEKTATLNSQDTGSTAGDSSFLYPSLDEVGALDVGASQEPNSMQTSAGQTEFTHFLYGSTSDVLGKLKANLEKKFPDIRIVGTYAPPFRPLNDGEERELQRIVAECRPDFFWVGLSTPKQERFMASHHHDSREHPLDCGIMLGVGAAFDIHAGLLKDAPAWIKNSGLQWFYRLCQEPKRLWRRYADIVPSFLWLAALQLLGIRKYSIEGENSFK